VAEPTLLIISQVYVPDPASVGQHLADAAQCLAVRGLRVRVLTSARGYDRPEVKYPRWEMRSGVEVVRLPLSSLGKRTLVHRVVGQLLFLIQAIVRGITTRGLAGILVSTSPPMASFAALVVSFVRRVPITYWLMDLNPDQAVRMGKASNSSIFVRMMRWLNCRIYARAANVVVLDRFMAERVASQYRVNGRLEILPPWPHEESIGLAAGEKNPFAAEHNPDGRFVVMYSGNHSLASPITTLLQAALRLEDDGRFCFMFIGEGQGKREVDEAIRSRRPANILSLPYQPLERLRYSLSTADLHVVTLGNDMVGIIHPCKIYGAMAVGRPILFIGPRPSHAADIVERHGVGRQVAHGDVDGLIAAIEAEALRAQSTRAETGRRAVTAVHEHYSKERLCGAFCDVVERGLKLSRVAAAKAPMNLERPAGVAASDSATHLA
jgi:colanic acid biosynthesis glycosyl transferase WcaI